MELEGSSKEGRKLGEDQWCRGLKTGWRFIKEEAVFIDTLLIWVIGENCVLFSFGFCYWHSVWVYYMWCCAVRKASSDFCDCVCCGYLIVCNSEVVSYSLSIAALFVVMLLVLGRQDIVFKLCIVFFLVGVDWISGWVWALAVPMHLGLKTSPLCPIIWYWVKEALLFYVSSIWPPYLDF